MAIFHLTAKMISRGKGQSAIAAAAYRSGERLEDEQAGEPKFYQTRADRIQHTAIMAPKDAPEWAHDRNALWNHVERAEKRKDAQLAREIEVSLPHEMTAQQREWLIKDFAREAFVRQGYVVDIAIHAPDKNSDERNHHAHLMITRRTIGPDGFAATKDWRFDKAQIGQWREQFATLTNRHLERHGIDARVDHRSLEAQGIDREPTVHVGYAGMEIAQRGGESDRYTALQEIMERNDIRLEMLRLAGELVPLEALHASHLQAEADGQRERANKQLEKAARADDALLRAPAAGAVSFERSVSDAINAEVVEARQERRDAKFQADQDKWRAKVDDRNPDQIKPVATALEVVDTATGAVSKLGDFILDLVSSSTATPAPREPDMAAFVSDPQARKEHQLAQLAASQQASEADKALDRIRKDWEDGRKMTAEDIRSLTPEHQNAVYRGGDDVLRQMVDDARKRSEQYWRSDGRERER